MNFDKKILTEFGWLQLELEKKSIAFDEGHYANKVKITGMEKKLEEVSEQVKLMRRQPQKSTTDDEILVSSTYSNS